MQRVWMTFKRYKFGPTNNALRITMLFVDQKRSILKMIIKYLRSSIEAVVAVNGNGIIINMTIKDDPRKFLDFQRRSKNGCSKTQCLRQCRILCDRFVAFLQELFAKFGSIFFVQRLRRPRRVRIKQVSMYPRTY